MGMGRRGGGRRYGKDRPHRSQAPKPMLQPSPAQFRTGGPATTSPTLGKHLAPPTPLLPFYFLVLLLTGLTGQERRWREKGRET